MLGSNDSESAPTASVLSPWTWRHTESWDRMGCGLSAQGSVREWPATPLLVLRAPWGDKQGRLGQAASREKHIFYPHLWEHRCIHRDAETTSPARTSGWTEPFQFSFHTR